MTNMTVARTAYTTALAMGADAVVLLALFETGIVESGFKTYANPKVPESMAIPHDAVGSDHFSVGFLQQQVPGWGTAAQCMDPAHATRSFVRKAMELRHGHPSWDAGRLAQAVQVSAFPDRYGQQAVAAKALIDQVASTLNLLKEIEMFGVVHGRSAMYVGNGIHCRHIPNGEAHKALGSVQPVVFPTRQALFDALGVLVGPDPGDV
jgi:hypothetical protein